MEYPVKTINQRYNIKKRINSKNKFAIAKSIENSIKCFYCLYYLPEDQLQEHLQVVHEINVNVKIPPIKELFKYCKNEKIGVPHFNITGNPPLFKCDVSVGQTFSFGTGRNKFSDTKGIFIRFFKTFFKIKQKNNFRHVQKNCTACGSHKCTQQIKGQCFLFSPYPQFSF